MTNKLKWYVKFDDKNNKVQGFPWGVWKGNFRDSTHECKHFAEERKQYLQELDDSEDTQ